MRSIALFTECYHPMRNGVVVSVTSLARVFTELGHAVTIFTAHHPDQESQEDENIIRFPSITFPSRARYPMAIPVATGEARRLLQEEHFDIIHSNSLMGMGQVAVAWHRRREIPLIFTYHTLIDEYTHYIPLPQKWLRRGAVHLSREYSNSANQIIAPSRYVATRLRRFGVTQPITVIPTGIDLDEFDAVPPGGEVRERYNIPTGVPLLVYAGRLAREKNLPRLLRAFRLVRAAEPDAHLLMIGGGPFERGLCRLIEELELTSHVHLTGFVPRDEVVRCLRAGDCFFFTSRTETQGLVIGEAMACHIPVVAVNAAATAETVSSGVEGLLVPDADAPLAEAALTLLRDANLRAQMGQAARSKAENLSLACSTRRVLEVYEQAIADGAAPDLTP